MFAHDAVVFPEAHLRGRRGQTDRAFEVAQIGQVDRIHRHDRRAFGQPIAFDDRLAGDRLEAIGDRLLRGHAAGHRELQVREVALAELLVVEERVVERVHRGHAGEFLVTDDHHHALHVARIGDQDVAPAESHEDQRVHGQRIDVIERQRREHRFDVAAQLTFGPRLRLQQVGDDVPVREHRAFGHAGGAAGVLQEGDVVVRGAHGRQRPRVADRERVEQRHRFRQVVLRHHLLHMAQHEIEQTSLQIQAVGEQIAETRHDDVLHFGAGQRVFDGLREVLEHDDGLRAAVLQLMREFTHRVERIHVDHHAARLEHAEQRDRILERIRQHDRDAFAGLHADALQIRGERGRLAAELAVRHVRADAHIRDALAKLRDAFVEELHDRLVLVDVDLMRHVCRIGRVPDAVGVGRAIRLPDWAPGPLHSRAVWIRRRARAGLAWAGSSVVS